MKIAFFLDNRHIPGVDFSDPELGNPGSGACEYLHVAIPYFIDKYCAGAAQIVIIAPHIDKLPPHLKAIQAHSVTDAASKAKENGADFFVFRPRQKEEENILDHIKKIKLPSIGRAALTPTPDHVRKMAGNPYFKALVCVGREQYDSLLDSPLWSKIAYIDNGIHLDSCWIGTRPEDVKKDARLVVYMGALVPMKGFHVLAQAWTKVLQKFPDAKLSVIGSVKMYGDRLSVGPLGIADDNYERTYIIPYLCDASGKVHPSVTFHGQMGPEKFDIIRRALVGVPNPTGQTETCCVSAVEMSACKAAVVSGAYYALLDTVWHNKTGLLGRGVDHLARDICACLENPKRAQEMGEAGYARVRDQYDFSHVAPRWLDLCQSLTNGRVPGAPGGIKNIRYHYKLLRLINAPLQKILGRVMIWPSVMEAQAWVLKILR